MYNTYNFQQMALYSKVYCLIETEQKQLDGRVHWHATVCHRKSLISSNLKAELYKIGSTKRDSSWTKTVNMLSQIWTVPRCSAPRWDIPSFTSQAELTARAVLKDSKANRTIRMSLLLHTSKDLVSGPASHFYVNLDKIKSAATIKQQLLS